MNDLAALVFHVEVRDVERRNRPERQREYLVDLLPAAPPSQVPSDLSQRTQDLRAIESLTVTVFAETHRGTCSIESFPIARQPGCARGTVKRQCSAGTACIQFWREVAKG